MSKWAVDGDTAAVTRRPGERGDADAQVVGCVFQLIVFLVFLGTHIALGGVFRTAVSWNQPQAITGTSVPFREELTARHWLGGLVQGEQADIGAVLARQQSGRSGVVTKLTVTTRHKFVDSLITVVTLGIYCPMTVSVQGELVIPAGGRPDSPAGD